RTIAALIAHLEVKAELIGELRAGLRQLMYSDRKDAVGDKDVVRFVLSHADLTPQGKEELGRHVIRAMVGMQQETTMAQARLVLLDETSCYLASRLGKGPSTSAS